MLLIGMYDSPYVRRVAVGMHLCGIAYEHGDVLLDSAAGAGCWVSA